MPSYDELPWLVLLAVILLVASAVIDGLGIVGLVTLLLFCSWAVMLDVVGKRRGRGDGR